MLNVAFYPLGKPTFHRPSADSVIENSVKMLKELFGEIKMPEALLTNLKDQNDFSDTLQNPDLIIYQCSTFVGGDCVTELTRRFNCPVVVWSVREPSIDGTRLKLNSLTGAFSAGNSLYTQDKYFEFIFGNPDEDATIKAFTKIRNVLDLVKYFKTLNVGLIGTQPAGFGFGNIDEADLARVFGSSLTKVEAYTIINKANSYSSDDLKEGLEELTTRTTKIELVPDENKEKYARLRKAFEDFVKDNNIGAVASRCWPDFFTEYGAPVCAVLSMLNDNGVPSSCEADMGGAISMVIGSKLTNTQTYFGDPVAIDETVDGIVYWHCGAGASKLAKGDATLGVHPNRQIGPTMEFGLKHGEVTVLRLGKSKDGFRMFVMKGDALDEPQKFYGTSVVVKPKGGESVKKVSKFVKDGWEPHFVVCYGDIVDEVKMLCEVLNIEVFEY